jgi:GTPase
MPNKSLVQPSDPAPDQTPDQLPVMPPELEPTLIKRSGYIAIVGRPNVGKSTLINCLVAAKVSITCAKPQTTRHRILGIVEWQDAQIVLIDTPGFQTTQRNPLNSVLNKTVQQALGDADAVLMVCDAHGWTKADDLIIQLLPKSKTVILALNKIDAVKDLQRQMQLASHAHSLYPFKEIIPISAEKRTGIDTLLRLCADQLPKGDRLYEQDQLSDRSERFLAAELIREKLFRLTGDELPYTSTVVIEQFKEEGALRRIHATILIERESHKAMILGFKGEKIKRISSEARVDMERMFGGKVYLEVWIKVKSGWADSEQSLRAYGYD